jgi:hypothetical protein
MDTNKLKIAFGSSNFANDGRFDNEHDIELLLTLSSVLSKYNQYENDIFQEYQELIDIFCLQELYQIALRISLDEDNDEVDSRAGNYFVILREIEMNFNLTVALARKDFFVSDFYDEDEEDNDTNLIKYLIAENYDRVIKLLKKDYSSNEELLEFIIKDFSIFNTYEELKNGDSSFEDFFDYPEIMRLHAWADGGFCLSGEA